VIEFHFHPKMPCANLEIMPSAVHFGSNKGRAALFFLKNKRSRSRLRASPPEAPILELRVVRHLLAEER